MSGWVCSYRKIWGHPIFANNALRVGVWHWMMHKAAWKPVRFRVNSKIVEVARGQLCVSHRQVCEETGMPHRQLRTFLRELEKEGAITQDTTQGRTLITIRKYEEYQAKEPASDTGKDTQPTQTRHTKEQVNTLTTPSNEGDALSAPESSTVEVSVSSSAVWNAGKPFLSSRGVANPGAMIGRWLKSHPPLAILAAIETAQRAGTQDPVPYITQILNGAQHDASNHNSRASQGRQNRVDPALEQIARLAGLGQAPGAGRA